MSTRQVLVRSLLLAAACLVGTPVTAQSEMSARHRQWLDVVAYIIEDHEQRIFEGLGTEWQRERFIAAFWKRRDPLPVTPENEFYVEHMRRWAYANEVLGRDTPVPGWKTDRGRVYIVNGAPFKVHPYPNTQQLWPLEVWEYRDTPRLGMPGFYQIIFFKPRVFNEWRLYSPSVDGPEGLVITTPADIDLVDFQALATKFPIVFLAAQRVAPGYDALGSEAVIARTMAPPPPPRPLSMFYTPSGDVETAFMSGAALDLKLEAGGYAHPELEGYVDLSIEIPTSETTFLEVDDRMVANYELELEVETATAGTRRESGGSVVVRIPRDQFEQVRALPLLYRQRIWLLPGPYRIRALVTEVATRRVGVAEADAVVPEGGEIAFGGPTLFYATEGAGAGRGDWRSHIPWVGSRLRRGLPVGSIVRVAHEDGADLPVGLELEYRLVRGSDVVWSDTWSGEPAPGRDRDGWAVTRALSIEAVPAGSYELQVRASRRSGQGSVVDLGTVGRRQVELVDDFLPFARILPVRDDGIDLADAHHQLGLQLLRRDDFARARAHFESATRLEPRNPTYAIDAGKTLVLAGELAMAERLLVSATRRAERDPEAWATLGLLRLQQGQFEAAIEAYERSLDAGPGTPAVYNGMAEALLSTGSRDRALEMLERSLEINPAQDQVRQLRDRLKATGGVSPPGSR